MNKSNNGYDQFFKKAQQLSNQEGRAAIPQKKQNQLKKKATKGIPWKIVCVSFVGLLIGFIGLHYSEGVEKLIKKFEVNFLGAAVASEKAPTESKDKVAETTKKSESLQKLPEADEAAPSAEKKPSTNEYIASLTQRQKELDAKEEELKKFEAEIKIQKEELEKKAQELEQTRRQISSVLQERIQVDDKKIESLVQVYTNMKPQQAAKIFEDMDEDLAVEIIGRMKKKNAAEIMNLMKPEKAKYYSEKYAGYKRNTQP